MYNPFFGFKESPFQLVPNPAYLFLGSSHEEAMAHLEYAIANGDGFVEITGEVGTGKTTICRAFLENLEQKTAPEIAYIFNPQMDARELLRAINREFDLPATAESTVDLIDTLNTFLLENKSRGKNAVLLIDEAQNLSLGVLEQLRLLSNLETNTGKLLQIILVGQPELRDKLNAHQLRQLRQRITLSRHLAPLSHKETRAYIRHRLRIASGGETEDTEYFTEPALRVIHTYSGGIPRLINIACDRALLNAFGFNRPQVTGPIAARAVKELNPPRPRRTFSSLIIGGLIVLCLVLAAALWLNHGPFNMFNKKTGNTKTNPNVPEKTTTPIKTPGQFLDYLAGIVPGNSGQTTRSAAMEKVLSLWNVPPGEEGNVETLTLRDGEWQLIECLNLPAILEFRPPGVEIPRYLTLTRIQGDRVYLESGGKTPKAPPIILDTALVKACWTGVAHIPWRNFLGYRGMIPTDAPLESVVVLKMLLRQIGYRDLPLDGNYDDLTRRAVEQIQQKHGLDVDGIVGTRTRIVIYNEKSGLNIPHIRKKEEH